MTIQISKPFSTYITVEELPKTRDRRDFVFYLPFQVEGTNRQAREQWPWSYSGSQEAIDLKAGIDGLTVRSERELEAFRRYIERELEQGGYRLYTDGERPVLIRARVTR